MTSIWFQAHHVEHAATVAGTWVMAAFSNVVSSYRIRIACTCDRTAHMRLNSSAQPRKRALTAGLPLCSEPKWERTCISGRIHSDQTVRSSLHNILTCNITRHQPDARQYSTHNFHCSSNHWHTIRHWGERFICLIYFRHKVTKGKNLETLWQNNAVLCKATLLGPKPAPDRAH
jgi:hypothetical protein